MVIALLCYKILFPRKKVCFLDKIKQKEIDFEELPKLVKDIYLDNSLIKDKNKPLPKPDSVLYIYHDDNENIKNNNKPFFNLDCDYVELAHFEANEGKDYFFWGHDKNFRLRYKKGKPFVLYQKKFYYTKELELDEGNVTNAKYIAIDLDKYLNYNFFPLLVTH